jgi:hypothetical protein
LPTYPIYNKDTGERSEIILSLDEWDKFKDENPNIIRDWSDPSTAPSSVEQGEWKDKLAKSHPGWNEMLGRMSKVPGSKVEKI